MPNAVSPGRSQLASVRAPRLAIDTATLDVLQQAQRSHGERVRFEDDDGKQSIFLNDPKDVREILVRHHRSFAKGRDFERVKMLLGNGIIVSDGDTWRTHRRMMQPSFTRGRIATHLHVMEREVQRVCQAFAAAAASADPLDVTRLCSDFSLRVILRSIFGDNTDELDNEDGSGPFRFLSQEFARDLRAVTRLRAARERVAAIIDARRESDQTAAADFLQGLIDARDKDGHALSEREIIDEVMTLVVAGYETSAGTLNWAWSLLATRPDWTDAIAKEAADHLPGGETADAKAITALTTTRQILMETLRLYPPVWLFSRRVVEVTEIGELQLEPGTEIFISPYLLHRREEFWPLPEQFDPARFSNSVDEDVFIPFSLGPRRCIGEHYAFLEMQLHLARVCTQYRVRPTTELSDEMALGINLRSATNFELTVEERE